MRKCRCLIAASCFFFSCLVINCSTVNKLSQQEINTFRQAKTVRIIVEESYNTTKYSSLPFESLAQRYLKYGGLRVVSSDEKKCDATLRIRAQGTALGAHYKDKSSGIYMGYLYTGVRLKGEISFEIQGIHPYKRKFGGESAPPETVKLYGLPTSASAEPSYWGFADSFHGEILQMMGEIYGANYWISSLKDDQFYSIAYWKLRGIGEPAVEPLIAGLEDEKLSVRRGAAELLGKIKDSRAAEPLITALKDKDSSVRFAAAEALGEIKDSRAVEPLIVALKDEKDSVKKAAAKSLEDIKDARAVEPLIGVLQDKDPNFRRQATEALGEIKDSRAVEPLTAVLKDEDHRVRDAAEKALNKIRKQ